MKPLLQLWYEVAERSPGLVNPSGKHLIISAADIMLLGCEIERVCLPPAPPSIVETLPNGWQPIETAPSGKKGYCWMLLAWGPEADQSTGIGMRMGDKYFAAGSFYCLGQEKEYEFREVEVIPTHWMPLPAAPTSENQNA